ncbi:SAM-dependent methyltransferase [Actinomadura atramentaria]|uniref:SAM-dependent methyltransferase n=1 Tax=Actinomadura atramentaria TaxID=1990 RepID=UPI001F0B32CD|nr:SAM-dependent methyltransferase [Actinomadura atramentaria]
MYDCLLGGKDHFAADRAFAEDLVQRVPRVVQMAQANRTFLRRAVRHAVSLGFHQFLDLGSGLPSGQNVHEIVGGMVGQRERVGVVYVDRDPVVAVHGRAYLETSEWVRVVQRDFTDPEAVLADHTVRGVVDFDQPVVLVFASVLHFVGGCAAGLVRAYLEASRAGGAVIISHVQRPDTVDDDHIGELESRYQEVMGTGTARTRTEILDLFNCALGTRLVEPGLVNVEDWRPDRTEDGAGDNPLPFLAGMGIFGRRDG